MRRFSCIVAFMRFGECPMRLNAMFFSCFFLFLSACSSYDMDLSEYLGYYSAEVKVEEPVVFTSEYREGEGGEIHIPSYCDAQLQINLKNPKSLPLDVRVSFDGKAIPKDPIIYQDSEKKSLHMSFNPQELEQKKISLRISMQERETKRKFPDYSFTVLCNSPPGQIIDAAEEETGVKFTLPSGKTDVDLEEVFIEWFKNGKKEGSRSKKIAEIPSGGTGYFEIPERGSDPCEYRLTLKDKWGLTSQVNFTSIQRAKSECDVLTLTTQANVSTPRDPVKPLLREVKGEERSVIYLGGDKGDDGRDGASQENSVKTFQRAKELLVEGGTIYLCGTVTVEKEEEWDLAGKEESRIQMACSPEFTEKIVKIIDGGTLTLKDIVINKNNEDPGSGGAIFSVEGGKLVLKSGTILGNDECNGNAVCVKKGEFWIDGTVKISDTIRLAKDQFITISNNAVRNLSQIKITPEIYPDKEAIVVIKREGEGDFSDCIEQIVVTPHSTTAHRSINTSDCIKQICVKQIIVTPQVKEGRNKTWGVNKKGCLVRAAPYAVGDYYYGEDGAACGKVYEIEDGGNHGMIMTIEQSKEAGVTELENWCKQATFGGLQWRAPTGNEVSDLLSRGVDLRLHAVYEF